MPGPSAEPPGKASGSPDEGVGAASAQEVRALAGGAEDEVTDQALGRWLHGVLEEVTEASMRLWTEERASGLLGPVEDVAGGGWTEAGARGTLIFRVVSSSPTSGAEPTLTYINMRTDPELGRWVAQRAGRLLVMVAVRGSGETSRVVCRQDRCRVGDTRVERSRGLSLSRVPKDHCTRDHAVCS